MWYDQYGDIMMICVMYKHGHAVIIQQELNPFHTVLE